MKTLEKAKEDENIDLRLQVGALTAKLDAAKPVAPSKKRKKQDVDVIPYPRSPKKAKLNVACDLSSTVLVYELTESVLEQGGEIGTCSSSPGCESDRR
jgi:hypothetical protein